MQQGSTPPTRTPTSCLAEELGVSGGWVRRKLQKAIEARRLCILTGAGVSYAIANLPLWDGLLKGALDFADKERHLDPKYINVARESLEFEPLQAGSTIRNLLSRGGSNVFSTWLAATFGDPVYNPHHELLQVLGAIHQSDPFIRFATTNFDMILDDHLRLQEVDWDEDHHVSEFFAPAKPRNLLHIHGTYSRPQSVVFSSNDYAQLAGQHRNAPFIEPLQRLLDNYTVLFIGCGGTTTDPHFSQVFDRLQRATEADHVLLYRRAPGDTKPTPDHPRIFSYSHDDYGDLPGTIRRILPELLTPVPPPVGPVAPTPERATQYAGPLELAPPALRSNKEFVTEAVKQHGLALRFASPALRGDREVVLEAVRQDGSALQFASSVLQGDKDVVSEAVWKQGLALQFASPVLRGDKDVVIEAVKQQGLALQYAGRDVGRGVGRGMRWKMDRDLCGDKDVVLEAVKRDGRALRFASSGPRGLQSDKNVVLEAVKQHGSALKYASSALQEDRNVVLEAVKQDGSALKYAASDLQADKDVVLMAVKQRGSALKYATSALQEDKDVVLEAVKQDRSALKYAASALQADNDVISKVGP